MENKKQAGVWMDRSKAIIVTLYEGHESVKEFEAEIDNAVYHHGEGDKGSFMGDRHLNNERKFNEREKHQVSRFLDQVADHIRQCDELIVMGPSDMKYEFRSVLESDKQLAPKLKSVEPADKMTDRQLVALVRDYYKS